MSPTGGGSSNSDGQQGGHNNLHNGRSQSVIIFTEKIITRVVPFGRVLLDNYCHAQKDQLPDTVIQIIAEAHYSPIGTCL